MLDCQKQDFNKELYLKVKSVYHNLITSGLVHRGYSATRL